MDLETEIAYHIKINVWNGLLKVNVIKLLKLLKAK